jgi:hypothetical protein
MVEKLLCPVRFLALRRRTDPNWVIAVANINKIIANTYPHLLTTYGSPKIPDPITVLIIVVTVSRKSG